MSKTKLNIIKVLLLATLISLFLIKIITPLTISLSEELPRMKIEKFVELPSEYLDLFKNNVRSSISHINTISPVDSSFYPVTRVKYNLNDIAIFKFDFKFSSSIKKTLKVETKKTRKTTIVWYTPLNVANFELNYSADLKKDINYINLYIQKPFDTLSITNNHFVGKGILKTLSLKFSKEDKSNVIFVDENSFFNKVEEYIIVIFKKENHIYILFFGSSTNKIISKEELYEIINF